MNLKRISEFGLSMVLSLSSLLVIAVPKVHAATVTWDGGGADNNFSTAANWSGDVAPLNGDTLVFPTSVDADTLDDEDRVLNNDLTSLVVAGIQVTGTYAQTDYDFYRISGADFSTSGNIIGNGEADGYPVMYIDSGVSFTANAAGEAVTFSDLNIGANTVTLKSAFVNGSYTGTGGSLVMSGFENGGSGGGGGCSYDVDPDSPSFASSITVNEYGAFGVDSNDQGAGYGATSITVNGGFLSFSLPFNQDLAFNKGLTLNGGEVVASQSSDENNNCASPSVNKTVTIPGDVTLTADTTFYMYDADIKFTGTVTGKEFIKPYFASSGKVIFSDGTTLEAQAKTTEYSANSPGTSIYVANNETAVVTGTYGGVTVGEGGVLKGTGTVGEIYVDKGGKLAPGLSPGCINTGNLNIFGIYEVELGGTTACTEYDQTKVTGTVDVTGGTLNVLRFNTFKPVAGQTYTIIDNDSNDAVTGTFLTLAEGATFTADGYVYRISYVGGDGNDVVLTVVSVPASPNTGLQMLTNSPLATLGATMLAAGALLVITKKYNRVSSRR